MIDRVLLILGPTAGGKSDLAMELARRLGGEIVSADSMQIYRGMDLGTAKATSDERREIPHHGIDLVEPWDDGFTVASWLEVAERAIGEIRARGCVPIVVGGTNLYIRALLEGLDEAPAADHAFRAALESASSESLHALLASSDPPAAARLHPNDRRRVIRALEIAHTTGRPASAQRTAWDEANPVARRTDLFTVQLEWPIDALNRRINARVRRMFEAGLVDEVRAVLARGALGMQARGAVGYAEVAALVGDGSQRVRERDLDEAIESTKIRTRRLARQQRTWLKRFRALAPGLLIPCDETTTTDALASACVSALARA